MQVEVLRATENPERLVCQAARGDYFEGYVGDTEYAELMEGVDYDEEHVEDELTMPGRIDETYYSELKERKLSDQTELEEFSDDETTYIAVVSEPRGKMEKITDEVIADLGMPKWAFYNFIERRAGYRTNSAVDDPHNKAWRDTGLGAIYRSYVGESERAKGQIRDLVERVISGEDITLVCYEEEGKKCHRHILVDVLRDRVQSREDCQFDFTV